MAGFDEGTSLADIYRRETVGLPSPRRNENWTVRALRRRAEAVLAPPKRGESRLTSALRRGVRRYAPEALARPENPRELPPPSPTPREEGGRGSLLRRRRKPPQSDTDEPGLQVHDAEEIKIHKPARSFLYRFITPICGIASGGIAFGLALLFFVWFTRAFFPPCPHSTWENRECNNRGECLPTGLCSCDALYSGRACEDTLVPGYDIKSNTECNGNGGGYPFIDIPAVCAESWVAVECIEYVEEVRAIIEANGPEAAGYRAFTIPSCLCRIGTAGRECYETPCPRDENFQVCGMHGNTSVGLVTNGTAGTGNGCQCGPLTNLFTPPLSMRFTQAQLFEIVDRYYVEFNMLYCGTFLEAEGLDGADPDNPVLPSYLYLLQLPEDYMCFCEDDWAGVACTEGKCPMNPATEAICYNQGHPALGLGYEPNSTFSVKYDGTPCPPACADGFGLCPDEGEDVTPRCYPEQSATSPSYYISRFCDGVEEGSACPDARPVRCMSGLCSALPPDEGGNPCLNGFEEGVYDSLNATQELYACRNLTLTRRVTECLQNITVEPTVIGLLEDDLDGTGGIYLNMSRNLTLDFGSPLVLFSALVTTPGVGIAIETWDGQVAQFDGGAFMAYDQPPALFSGAFSYDADTIQEAGQVELQTGLVLSNLPFGEVGLDFAIAPMSWNYTATQLFNESFATFTLFNEVAGVFYSFVSRDSGVQLTGGVNLTVSTELGYVLVREAPAQDNIGERWFWPPSGLPAQRSTCLSQPGDCSWFVDTVERQVRSLDSAFYICNTGTQAEVTTVPCPRTYDEYNLTQSFFSWETAVEARSDIIIPQEHRDILFSLVRNETRTEWPFTIFFEGQEDGLNQTFVTPTALVQELFFLTAERMRAPCACQPDLYNTNKTTRNLDIFSQTVTRSVSRETLLAGDLVLAGRYFNGVRRLIEGVVAEVGIGNTSLITPRKGYEGGTFPAYIKDLRSITPLEYVNGLDNTETEIAPARCPDGSASRLGSFEQVVPVTCNCTHTVPALNCSCLDARDTGMAPFGCFCNTTAAECACGFPADSAFESRLWETVEDLSTDNCTCLIDISASSPTTVTLQPGSPTAMFSGVIPSDGIAERLYIRLDGDYPTAEFVVRMQPSLFTDVGERVGAHVSGNGTDFYLLLFANQSIPYDSLNVTTSEGSIARATLILSASGFALPGLEAGGPTFSASANVDLAPNVLTPDMTRWHSSESLHEQPTWIEMEFEETYFANYARVSFWTVGTPTQSGVAANRVFLMAARLGADVEPISPQATINDGWYTLGSFNSSAYESLDIQTLNFTTPNATTFNRFRLISPANSLSIQQFELFTNQTCDCPSAPGVSLALAVPSVDALVSVQEWVDDIEFFNANTRTDCNCLCEDDCIVTVVDGVQQDVSNDGFCSDDIYSAAQLGIPISQAAPNVTFFNFTGTFRTYLPIVIPENPAVTHYVEFAFNSTYANTPATIAAGYETWLLGGMLESANDFQSDVYFLEADGTVVRYDTLIAEETLSYDAVGAPFFIRVVNIANVYGSLIADAASCLAGKDCSDCGSSCRRLARMQGYGCGLNESALTINDFLEGNRTLADNYPNRTYLVSNVTQQIGVIGVTAFFQGINVNRTQQHQVKLDCGVQVCPTGTPYRCRTGQCVDFLDACDDHFVCPGNGCVELIDASVLGNRVFRCACAPGFGGNACQFGNTQPARPFDRGAVPPGDVTFAGGPPKLTILPPVDGALPLENMDNGYLLEENERPTGNSIPRGPEDVDYHRVGPISGWGQAICRTVIIVSVGGSISNLLREEGIVAAFTDPGQRLICTTCPWIRERNGIQYLLPDDVITRDPVTGEVTEWRTDPDTGEVFEWNSIATYDEAPFRCANGQCVPHPEYCAASELIFPVCNNRGSPRADGSCTCEGGWRTFSITDAYTESLLPGDPTIWRYNSGWQTRGLNQCLARDCTQTDCSVPRGCFAGTPELDFLDAQVPCTDQTRNVGYCAPSLEACADGTQLTEFMVCSGKGISRQKDFTGEFYCACGSPRNAQAQVANTTSVAELVPNGFGGLACDIYRGGGGVPAWSELNWATGEAYRSDITGDPLPGIWTGFSGAAVGPDPDRRSETLSCCPTDEYPRLELCPNVACLRGGEIICTEAKDCVAPDFPQVFACNNHGLARADGTCLCDSDRVEGVAYTFDAEQFSNDGCYRRVQCALSPLNDLPCHAISGCGEPAEWPSLPTDAYYQQQWYNCLGAIGLLNITTATQAHAVSANEFADRIFQAATSNALLVNDAIIGLATCICVGPNDTATDKCCMLPGPELRYEQNYAAPYELPGTIPGHPLLQDGQLASALWFDQWERFLPGEGFVFEVADNSSIGPFVFSAFRVFNYPVLITELTFTNLDTGGEACEPYILDAIDAGSTVQNQLTWGETVNGGPQAHYCGPSYTCLNFRENPLYLANCGISDEALRCIDWKRTTCAANPLATYWAPGTPDSFRGCRRDADVDFNGCVCCLLTAPYDEPRVSRILVNVTQGEILIGQARFYGFGRATPEVPAATRAFLDRIIRPSECNDFAFLQQGLGPDRVTYAPLDEGEDTQEKVPRLNATERCEATAGELGLPDGVNQDVSFLVDACASLPESDNRCWVAATDPSHVTEFINRTEILGTACDIGCYDYKENAQTSVTSRAVVSANETVAPTFLVQRVPTQFPTQVADGQLQLTPTLPQDPGSIDLGDGVRVITEPLEYPDCQVTFYSAARTPVNRFITEAQSEATNPNEIAVRNRQAKSYFISSFPHGRSSTYPWGTTQPVRAVGTLQYGSPIFLENEPYIHRVAGLPSTIISTMADGGAVHTNPPGCARVDLRRTTASSSRVITLDEDTVSDWDRGGGGATGFAFYVGVVESGVKFAVIYPKDTTYRTAIKSSTVLQTSGDFGDDFIMGSSQYPFVPSFLVMERLVRVDPFLSFDVPNSVQILTDVPTPYIVHETGLDFEYPLIYFEGSILDQLTPFPIERCRTCIQQLGGFYQWDQLRYSQALWFDFLDEAFDPRVHILFDTRWVPLADVFDLVLRANGFKNRRALETASHQVTTILDYAFIPDPVVPWELDSCVAVSSSGLVTAICAEELQFVCTYDYTRYAVVTGYQCFPPCGTSVRLGGVDRPGTTCFDEFPLANQTLFPILHEQYQAWQAGVLDIWADRFNVDVDNLNYTGSDLVSGLPPCWTSWAEDFSNRRGTSSPGETPQEAWVDMSLTRNFPVDCGLRTDPNTAVQERYCAVSADFCLLSTPSAAAQMDNSSRPTNLLPVDESLAFTDPSCGVNVNLANYFRNTPLGALQSELDNNQRLVSLDPVQAEVTSVQGGLPGQLPPSWYNSGKPSSDYRFLVNVTVTVSGQYRVLCVDCDDPVELQIFLHPTSPFYLPPTDRITVTLTPLVTDNQFQDYQVEFTVPQGATEIIAGIDFPVVTYRALGFEWVGLGTGSSWTLTDPIITDAQLRDICTSNVTREPEIWFEPPERIQSRAPNNFCEFSENGDVEIGQCDCGLPFDGQSCSCYATTSTFGKQTCGGFGDAGVGALSPVDGVTVLQTRTDTTNEAGCFFYDETVTLGAAAADVTVRRSACKVILIGQAALTLRYNDVSPWRNPSVVVEAEPISGADIFNILPNADDEQLLKSEVTTECAAEAQTLPYFTGSNEISQFVATFRFEVPVFVDLVEVVFNSTWQWESTGDFLFNDATATDLGDGVSICSTDAEACAVMNFNNLLYLQESTTAEFVDGVLDDVPVSGAFTITYSEFAPLRTNVYVWSTAVGPLTVTGCTAIAGSEVEYTIYECSLPNRVLDGTVTLVSEIQAFALADPIRTTLYPYEEP